MIGADTLVPGRAAAPVLALHEPLSFWGGYDAATGRIIDRRHPQSGTICAGRIIVVRAGRGSSSGSSVLAEALRAGTGPAGFVLAERDAILTVGALVALELYAVACPIVVAPEEIFLRLAAQAALSIDAGPAGAVIRIGA